MKKLLYVFILFGILISMSACTIKCDQHVYDDCGDTVCNVCGKKTEGETLGHSLEHYEMIDSTCTETGIIEYWYCNVCETYFTNEERTQSIDEENLVITQKEHIDVNNDYSCDYECGEVLLAEEKLQQIIQETLSSNKATVKEKYIPSNSQTIYYFDDNLLYVNVEEGQQENYYYTEEGTTYILTKTNEWTKETTTEEINYNISYLFDNKFNLEISSELLIYNCGYGFFEGSVMFEYTNSLGTQVDIKLNDDSTLLEGIYIKDENNNIIYMFEMVYGNDEEIVSNFVDINNYLDEYK